MRRRYPAIIGLLVVVVTLLPVLVSATPATASDPVAPDLGTWTCDSFPVSVAYKEEWFTNNFGGVGSGLPSPALAVVGNDYRTREWVVWLYPGPVTKRFAWSSAFLESVQPGGFPTGRIDVTGQPVVFYHDNDLKAMYGQWGGDGNPNTTLYRANFHCHYTAP